MLKTAFIIMHVWLHMYSEPAAWTTKYDSIYAKSIKKHGLKKYGVDVGLYKAIAVIESKQTEKLKGGGFNAYWGLFQISSELANLFGKVKQRKVLKASVNTEVFSKWMKFYIKKWLLPLKPKSMKFDSDNWRTFLYLAHNTGPNLVKWSLKSRYPLTSLTNRLVKKWGKKEGTYRMALGLLVNKLRVVANTKSIKKDVKVDWWTRRDKMLDKCVELPRKTSYRWKARTLKILAYQKQNNLIQTGVWDNRTEKSLLENCR